MNFGRSTLIGYIWFSEHDVLFPRLSRLLKLPFFPEATWAEFFFTESWFSPLFLSDCIIRRYFSHLAMFGMQKREEEQEKGRAMDWETKRKNIHRRRRKCCGRQQKRKKTRVEYEEEEEESRTLFKSILPLRSEGDTEFLDGKEARKKIEKKHQEIQQWGVSTLSTLASRNWQK